MPTATTHLWRPSSARTIVLDTFVPVPRGISPALPPPLSWPAKDPADVLDYQFDITPAFVGNDGDIITSIDAAVSPNEPGGVAISTVVADGAIAILWLTGGQAGITYVITLSIATINGRSIQRSILLPVLSLSSPPVPNNAIQTESGLPVTDQMGTPVITSS